MKKYLVFAGQDYSLDGGMDDFLGKCDSITEAKEMLKNYPYSSLGVDWWQIVDYKTMKIVEEK